MITGNEKVIMMGVTPEEKEKLEKNRAKLSSKKEKTHIQFIIPKKVKAKLEDFIDETDAVKNISHYFRLFLIATGFYEEKKIKPEEFSILIKTIFKNINNWSNYNRVLLAQELNQKYYISIDSEINKKLSGSMLDLQENLFQAIEKVREILNIIDE